MNRIQVVGLNWEFGQEGGGVQGLWRYRRMLVTWVELGWGGSAPQAELLCCFLRHDLMGLHSQDCTEAQWCAGWKWYPDDLWMQTMDRWAYLSSVNIFCLSIIICTMGTYLLGFLEAKYNRTVCHLGLSVFIRCRSNGCLLALKANVDLHFRLHLSFSTWDVYQLDLFQTFILKSLENYRGLPRCYGESSPSPTPTRGLSHLTVVLCHKQEPRVNTACIHMSSHFMSHVWIMESPPQSRSGTTKFCLHPLWSTCFRLQMFLF